MTDHVERSAGEGLTSRRALRRQVTSGFRRALKLTALGTILPGAGLTRARSRGVGWALLGTFLVSLALVVFLVLRRGLKNTGLEIATNADYLLVLTAIFAVGGLAWCISIIATAIQTRPAWLDRTRTRTLAAFTTIMVALIGGVSYKGAEYAMVTQQTVREVFSGSGLKPGDGATIAAGANPWADTPRVNILMLGSDAGVGRTGTRTDSMVVASIDTKTGHTTLISLPRNLMKAPLPEDSPLRTLYPSGQYGVPHCFRLDSDPTDHCMLNAIWTESDEQAANDPSAYAGIDVPGRYETKQVIGDVLGMKIDHLVVVDLKGFEQLIDAMGGVEINVKNSYNGGPLPIGGKVSASGQIYAVKGYFTPGLQKLDGWHALWYARSRAADDDYARTARQRCVIEAVTSQVDPAAMVAKYPDLARIARDNIYTDIPAASLPAFVTLMDKVQGQKMTSFALDGSVGVDVNNPDYDEIHALVQKKITPPKPKPKPTTTAAPTDEATATPTPTETTEKQLSPREQYAQCN